MIEQAAEVVASVAAEMAATDPAAEYQAVIDQMAVLQQEGLLIIVCLALIIGLLCSMMIVRHWRM